MAGETNFLLQNSKDQAVTTKLVKLAAAYSGTTIIGEPACYNHDRTTDIEGDTVAEGALNPARYQVVETPATANFHAYAGTIQEAGKKADEFVQIAVPDGNAIIAVVTDLSVTNGVTDLAIEDGSKVYSNLVAGRVVALAKETIDRSSTDGLTLAQVFPVPIKAEAVSVNVESRTTVQMPTAAIWQNFNLDELRRDPFAGSLLETDFRDDKGLPPAFADATYAAAALGKTAIEGIYPGITVNGELIFFTTEDNGAAEVQWPCPIDINGGASWAFEMRVKCVNITTEKGSWFVGLQTGVKLTGAQQADAGAAPVAASFIGFNTDAAATAALDTLYLLTGQAQNTHAVAIHTLVADTYFTIGLYYNGTDIAQYLNGVKTGTDILGTGDMDGADFPLAAVLVPAISVKGAHADDYTVTVDWIRVAQQSS